MSDGSFFVQKTEVNDLDLLEIGGTPVIENREALSDALRRLSGPDVANLFAEPVFRRGNGAAPAIVSWYAHLPDEPKPMSALDPEEREEVERLLRRKLGDVSQALSDPLYGPIVGAALYIRSSGDVWTVGGRPLILNWGMLPRNVGRSPEARVSHFQGTLGPYLPLDLAPPLTGDEVRRSFSTAPAETEVTGSSGVGSDATTGLGVTGSAAVAMASAENGTPPPKGPVEPPEDSGAPPPVPPRSEPRRGLGWRWFPLLLLLIVTTSTLLLFLFANVLVYPPKPKIEENEIAKIAEAANDALRERRDQLRRVLDESVCRPDGTLVLPDDVLLPGQVPISDTQPGTGGEGPASKPVTPDDVLPTPPERVNVPQPEGGQQNLLQYIEDRTAIVLVQSDASANKSGIGSGFFVGPELFVTNDHVVRSDRDSNTATPNPDFLFVKSKSLGRGLKAEVVKVSGKTEQFGRDFALLRVPGANAKYFPVWESTDSIKLQEVIAAGFPAAYFRIDANKDKLFKIDDPEMPDMIMTRGEVNAQQNVGASNTLALVHSADITKGNSGGPLVDQCGRVVAVNTFGIQDETTKRWLNFSLHTAELLDFLDEYRQETTAAGEMCDPSISPTKEPGTPDDTSEVDQAAPVEPTDPDEAAKPENQGSTE